ncbi:ATP-binding protein [Xenophilus sp. Marseille-Q4582]|uniref:ATP-binding protein n=1 Tax=Xenophilus sp. Marseille-Q4582 TaxID=2866600 RepID=UPI001CE3D242|nr:ATP-binding protein [Xenophilus sp. Marseille-Q4582]
MSAATPRFAGPSLQSRLARLLLGLFAAVWLGTAALAWFDARHEVEEILDSHLAQAAALLVAQPLPADAQARIDTPVLHRYAAKTALQVWADGTLRLRSTTAPVTALAPHSRTGFQTVQVGGQPWRVLVAAGAQPGQQVQVGQAVAARDDVLWAMFRSTLWPLLLTLPLMGLGIWAVVRHALRPLRALGDDLHARQPDALQRIPDEGLPREMQPMVEALNLLFARIAGLLSGERRFTADAAHEMRTPIAAIRAHAEVALRANAAGDDEARRQALARTLAGCDRATHLVTQLLTLSRLEAEGTAAAAAAHEVDLTALTRQVLAAQAPRALEQGQRLSLQAQAPWPLQGDEALLAVLLRNLIANALQHAGTGARIEVRIERLAGERTGLRIDDSGPGLDEADLERLGERFFRPAGTRASGSGLGWSIASRIAQAHGLRLQAQRSERLGGFCAVLRPA